MAQPVPAATEDPQAAAEKQKADDASCAQRWIAELTLSEKAQRKWLERARKITKLYKREDSTTAKTRRFAMLWANTQTIQPAVYTRPPQPVVIRRFGDADPVGRQASEILERAIAYSIDQQDLDGRLRQCSFDYVLLARGQTWERYVPTKGPTVTPEIDLQVVTSGDEGASDYTESYQDDEGTEYGADQVKTRDDGSVYAEGEPYEPIVYEESITDYVNWEDFGHSVARTWDEVDYVWRRVYLSRKQNIARFGEELGKRIPLDWGPKDRPRDVESAELTKKSAIYEIWCKSEKKTYWISKSFGERALDERDDPLGLDGFFPCPRPLLGTTGNDSAIPTPDYVFYQDQAEEIDKLTARIAVLQDALKVRGFYAGEKKNDLNNLLNSDTNILIPVPDWVTIKEGGGIRGNIDWFPIENVVAALNALIQQRQQLIEDVYQITGVSDIQRGESDPRETMGAQQIKSTWGSMRVRDRQLEMMRFARDILRIKGQVIAGKFSPDTLKAMTGVKLPTNAEKQQAELLIQQQVVVAQAQPQQQLPSPAAAGAPPQAGAPPMGAQPGQPPQAAPAPPPQPPQIPQEVQDFLASPSWEDVEALLANNAMREFRIDIETDSTIEPNESEEKARATELISALSSMIASWGPAIAAQPALAPMAGAIIKFAMRKFRAGRELEEVIDQTIDKITSQAANAPPPGAPPIDQTPVQVATINQQTEQITQQGETDRAQLDAEVKNQTNQLKQADQHLKLVAMSRDPTPQAQA